MEFPIPHIKFNFKWQVNKKSIIIIIISFFFFFFCYLWVSEVVQPLVNLEACVRCVRDDESEN